MYTVIDWLINIWFILNIWNGIKICWILRKHNQRIVPRSLISAMVFQSLSQTPWSKKIPLFALLGAKRTGTLYGILTEDDTSIKWNETYMIATQDIDKLANILPVLDYKMEVMEGYFKYSDTRLFKLNESVYLNYLFLTRGIQQQAIKELKLMARFERNVLVISDHVAGANLFAEKKTFEKMTENIQLMTK